MSDEAIKSAYGAVLQDSRVSVDELVATPEYRERFLRAARACGCTDSERDLLMRLISLRKRSKLPRASDLNLSHEPPPENV